MPSFECLLSSCPHVQSCIVLRFTRNEFVVDNETTVGAAFMTKTILLDDSDV
jgi:hypothetical protein